MSYHSLKQKFVLFLWKTTPIVHQNISSANVLLWRRDDQWRAKISAYCTANVCQNTRNDAATAMYYAPEALNKGTDQLICFKVSTSYRSRGLVSVILIGSILLKPTFPNSNSTWTFCRATRETTVRL